MNRLTTGLGVLVQLHFFFQIHFTGTTSGRLGEGYLL